MSETRGLFRNDIDRVEEIARLALQRPAAIGAPPTGPAGGALTGTFPNPGVNIGAASISGQLPAANQTPPTFFASLATLPAPAGGRESIQLDGFASSGDGGGGVFDWAATSTLPVDGGTVVAVIGVPTGRWIRRNVTVYSVRFFGAKGDGVTDDTAAINLAITAAGQASAQNGTNATVFFPSGIYMSTGHTLATNGNNGITISGAGPGGNTGFSASILRLSATASYLLATQGASIHLKDIWLDGNTRAIQSVLQLQYLTTFLRVDRAQITGAGSTALPGLFGLTNGSPTVVTTSNMTGNLTVGQALYFSQQPLTALGAGMYTLQSIDSPTQITLAQNYNGTSTVGSTSNGTAPADLILSAGSNPGLEIDNVRFNECIVFQNPTDLTKFAQSGYRSVNINASQIYFENCLLANVAYAAFVVNGHIHIAKSQAIRYTVAVLGFDVTYYESVIDCVFPEGGAGQYAVELNTGQQFPVTQHNQADTITFRNGFTSNPYGTNQSAFTLLCKQPIIIENMDMPGFVTINPDPNYGIFPPSIVKCSFTWNIALNRVTGFNGTHPEFSNIRDCWSVREDALLNPLPNAQVFSQAMGEPLEPRAWGMIPDAQSIGDAIIAGGSLGTLTSVSGKFRPGQVGQAMLIVGAGPAGALLATTISAYVSNTQVSISPVASTAVTNARADWGTDNNGFANTMIAVATAQGRAIKWTPADTQTGNTGAYLINGNHTWGPMRFERGASWIIPNGVTQTMAGVVTADPDQAIFSNPNLPVPGGGVVQFLPGHMQTMAAAEWFGTGTNYLAVASAAFGNTTSYTIGRQWTYASQDALSFRNAANNATIRTVATDSGNNIFIGDPVNDNQVFIYSPNLTQFSDGTHYMQIVPGAAKGKLVTSNGATPNALAIAAAGIGGDANPIYWASTTTNVAAGGTFTLVAPFNPYQILTGSLAANVTLVLPVLVGADFYIDATIVTLNGHTITVQANGVNWGTTIGTTNIYRVTYGGASKLYGVTLTP